MRGSKERKGKEKGVGGREGRVGDRRVREWGQTKLKTLSALSTPNGKERKKERKKERTWREDISTQYI